MITTCPEHLIGKLTPLDPIAVVPKPPEGWVAVKGGFGSEKHTQYTEIIVLEDGKWQDESDGLCGNLTDTTYAVPASWLPQPTHPAHVEIRLPDVAVKFDEVPVFELSSAWIAGQERAIFIENSTSINCLDIQSGKISVGHTREEALETYHKRKPKQ